MRLVHITTIPESLGFLRGQLAFMKVRGFDIVAISSAGRFLDDFAEEQAIPVRAVDMPRKITPLRDLVALWEMFREIRELRPTIVHAHTPKAGLLGTLAALAAGVPVRVYHMRGLPLVTARGKHRTLLKWTERISCLAATKVLCVSHSLRDVALAENLCPSDKISVLSGGSGNGVDSVRRFNPELQGDAARRATRERYGIPQDATVIGFVGRLVRDKGVVELLAAWREIAREFPKAHLLVLGMLEERDAIPAETAAELEHGERVHWQGHDWNSPPLYAAMDIVTLPTYREGFPNVPLEAASMQLPIVATRVSGCIDAIDDEVTGLLVPPADASALAAALRRYLRDPALRAAHGAAARDRVTTLFRQEVIWGALYAEYQALLANRGLPQPRQPDESAT